MKKLLLISLLLLATLLSATACGGDEPRRDGHEQVPPGGDYGDGISLLQGAGSINVRFERQ